MDNKYSDELLKKVHDTELIILKDFIQVCEKHKLNYFIVYGTALGAIRHKGFIPWDDDVDTGMLRNDFNKFEEIFDKELANKYNLVNPIRTDGFGATVTHLELKGTKFISEDAKDMEYEPGICIDIFVFDKLPKNRIIKKLHYAREDILGRLTFLCTNRYPHIPFSGIKHTIAKNICSGTHVVMNKIGITSRKLYKKLIRNAQKYNEKDGNEYTCLEAYDMVPNTVSYDDIFPLQKKPFENLEVNVMNNYDKNLTKLFGDYMKMPPKKLRVNHRPALIDFGEYGTITK